MRGRETDRQTNGLLKKQAMNYRTSSASSRDKRVVKNVVLLIFLHILLYLYKQTRTQTETPRDTQG